MSKKLWIGVAAAGVLLVYQFSVFNVVQDDAFISFRYVKNFLAGQGLVFNVGERVEGYTNFLWIMLLALLTKVGLPTIGTARTLGVLFSIGTLGVAAWGAYRYYPKRSWIWVLAVPFLLAANGSFAYWAGSGLETGLFTFLVASAAVTYLSYTPLSFCFLTLAALTRPEGALLAFLFGVIGILLKQKSWKTTLIFWGALALIMLPYALFKYFYFGSLLPNPFYAKTGFSKEYWQSGIEYFFLFQKHYGLYGLTILLPLLFYKKLTPFSRFCLLTFLAYALYVIAVGGDVLKAHRFWVPVVMLIYFPATDLLYQTLKAKWYGSLIFSVTTLILGWYNYKIPSAYLSATAQAEQSLIESMTRTARYFAANGSSQSFAISTIGAFSYNVGNRRVIDLLGLTDPNIARNPEKIEGLISTWKERHFSPGYVLSQKPDVILFSTGIKPSAPAERALYLYPEFRQNYRLEFYFIKQAEKHFLFEPYLRRYQDRPVAIAPDQSAAAVNLYSEGIHWTGKGDTLKGVTLIRESLNQGLKDCSFPYVFLSLVYNSSNQLDSAAAYAKKAMELDGGGPLSRYFYRKTLYAQGKYREVVQQDSILRRQIPNVEELLR